MPGSLRAGANEATGGQERPAEGITHRRQGTERCSAKNLAMAVATHS